MKDILLGALTKSVKPTVKVSLRILLYKCYGAALSDLDLYKHEEKLYNAISKIAETPSIICTD
jgi:hypothetical protein